MLNENRAPQHDAPAPGARSMSPGGGSLSRGAQSMSRRAAVLGAAALGASGLAACGRVRLGSPAPYTPPPPGIDDIYRLEILTLLDRIRAGIPRIDPAGDPPLRDALAPLRAAIEVQRTALQTGAEAEKEQDEREDPQPGATPSPAPSDPPTEPQALTARLADLRDLSVHAARQVSGSLARPIGAIAAYAQWSALRLHAAGHGTVPAPPGADEITPSRAVPADDPPSIAAESDYHAALAEAQREEWYGGYVFEVLAAEAGGKTRTSYLEQSEAHRTVAEQLAVIAEEDGAEVVHREAVYPLPGGTLVGRSGEQMPRLVDHALLVDHLALVGAAPFERRPLPIATALAAATRLAAFEQVLEPLPSLQHPEE